MEEENGKEKKQEKDRWDKLEIVFRPLNGLLTALAVGLLGYYTTGALRQREQTETTNRVYTELMTGREQAESGLRKDMFLSIMQSFLNRPDGATLEAKMLNLEMLAYNFHESLNLKPLFSHVDRQLEESTSLANKAFAKRLTRVAQEVTTRQTVLLEQVGEKFSRTVDFEALQKAQGGLALEPATLKLGGIERQYQITVTGVDREREEITIEMGVRTPSESAQLRMVTFHVGFYDFPMIDNTRLSHDQRAAVVLNQFGGDSAEVSLVSFPGTYASLKERVSYDELVEKLRQAAEPPK